MATAELVADGKMGKPHTQLGGLAAFPQRKEGEQLIGDAAGPF